MQLRPNRLATWLIAICLLLPSLAVQAGPGKRGQRTATRQARTQTKGLALRGRTPNPNHALRRQVRPEALLKATVTLISTGDLHLLPRHVRKALSKKARKPQKALLKAKTQNHLLQVLQQQVGRETYTPSRCSRALRCSTESTRTT